MTANLAIMPTTDIEPSPETCPEEPSALSAPEPQPSAGGQPALPVSVRILLYFAGWLLLLVGLLGLALPGLQGILTLVLGTAVLSLTSETIHRWMQRIFRPWPAAWQRFERFRDRLHHSLKRFHK